VAPLSWKKLDLTMKNLEQLCQLQKLLEDGVLSQKEFDSQKKIVVLSLNETMNPILHADHWS
jgi:hypothetical protein